METNVNEYMIQNTRWRIPNNYVQLTPLGHGGFGAVCSAFDNNLNKLVVLKKLTRPFETKEHAKRTYREIAVLMHVSHPHVIQLIDIFHEANNSQELNDIYLITPYMEMTLHDRLYNVAMPELTEDYKMIYTYQMLDGLRYLHSCNIIHRDIKPSNITISDRDLKIIDLGLARQESHWLMTGYVATRWYRAPEVMFQWQKYSKKIDVWSVACVLAEMYTRRAIFRSNNPSEHLALIIRTVKYPTQEHLESWDNYARTFIQQFSHIEVIENFHDSFPEIDSSSENGGLVINLLCKMLKLDPNTRFDVSQAIRHPYLSRYYEETDEVNGIVFTDPHEDEDNSIQTWKDTVFGVIEQFKTYIIIQHKMILNDRQFHKLFLLGSSIPLLS